MIPFHVELRPGGPIYEQIVYAATKAVISGQLRPGDSFPSVRSLSKELKINPNTAHKVINRLVTAGLLEIRPGSGTVVANRPQATKAEKTRLLEEQFEALIVESKRLGVELQDMQEALEKHWKRLNSRRPSKSEPAHGGREQQ
jgi:GntR family transcriptional regulator